MPMMMNLYDPWVIHCTVWGDGAEAVLRYLARYVFRVAEGRIVRLDGHSPQASRIGASNSKSRPYSIFWV
jgi:hypothetical protein